MTDTKLNTNKPSYTLPKSALHQKVELTLPTSKSISNRVLIMDALSEGTSSLFNLSNARDTETMQRLLQSQDDVLDVLDAGTTMRFLLAYLTAANQVKTLTGTDRMKQRPIGILVDALRELGADIEYLDKQGYPPIQIKGFDQQSNELCIQGDVSSQYISALLMIAPILPKGLTLTLEGCVGSKPYVEMTLQIMKQYGISNQWTNNVISIDTQSYQPIDFKVEGDWSGASYWYSFVALSDNSSVLLKGLAEASLQGDQAIVEIMKSLGVNTEYTAEGALLTKTNHQTTFCHDFTHSPDLAQTVAVVCATKGINAIFTGLQSLKIKETDRVLALQTELSKIGTSMNEEENKWTLIPSSELPSQVAIHTYEDHRMAMAFAPLCLLMDVEFDDASVVNKSYPDFWKDVKKATHKTV